MPFFGFSRQRLPEVIADDGWVRKRLSAEDSIAARSLHARAGGLGMIFGQGEVFMLRYACLWFQVCGQYILHHAIFSHEIFRCSDQCFMGSVVHF